MNRRIHGLNRWNVIHRKRLLPWNVQKCNYNPNNLIFCIYLKNCIRNMKRLTKRVLNKNKEFFPISPFVPIGTCTSDRLGLLFSFFFPIFITTDVSLGEGSCFFVLFSNTSTGFHVSLSVPNASTL